MKDICYDLMDLGNMRMYVKYKKNTQYELILAYLYTMCDVVRLIKYHTSYKEKKEYAVLDLTKVDLTLYMVENLQ